MNSERDNAVAALVAGSAAFGVAERTRMVISRGLANSRLGALWARIAQEWSASSWAERRRAVGTLMLVASLVHVVMLVGFGDYVSGFVFTLPALAAVIGSLAILTGSPSLARR